MALKNFTCGGKTIQYEETCGYSCLCGSFRTPQGASVHNCQWTISCNGKVVGTGTSKPRVRPKEDTLHVDGLLADLATSLEKYWGRSVTVPRGMRRKRVTGRFKGTPEQISERLGLKLAD